MKNRPYIICHMMTSLDGKITFGKINGSEVEDQAFDEYFDVYVATEAELQGQSVMFGRITMEMFAQPNPEPLSEFAGHESPTSDFILKNENNNYAFTTDTKGSLRFKENFITLSSGKKKINYNIVVIVTHETPSEYLGYLRTNQISYIFAGEKEINFSEAFKKIKTKLKVKKLILEGGGKLNGSILEAGFIDEISLLLLPVVINNTDTPSLFEHKMKEFKLRKFKLENIEKLDGDVVWMRYKKS